MSNEKMIDMIKNSVREIDSDARIILYGSRARGDERENSDWDIIVIVDNKKTQECSHSPRQLCFTFQVVQEVQQFLLRHLSSATSDDTSSIYECLK